MPGGQTWLKKFSPLQGGRSAGMMEISKISPLPGGNLHPGPEEPSSLNFLKIFLRKSSYFKYRRYLKALQYNFQGFS
jgi:hypothetical protein